MFDSRYTVPRMTDFVMSVRNSEKLMNIQLSPSLFSFAFGVLTAWIILENPETAKALWELLVVLFVKLGDAAGKLLDMDNVDLQTTRTIMGGMRI